MHLKEWRDFKKNLKQLPLEQELRVLAASLKQEKNREMIELIKQEIKEVQKEQVERKEWKKIGTPQETVRLPELVREERETPPRGPEREEQTLERTVAREQVDNNAEQKQHAYLSSTSGEYKSSKYEDLAVRGDPTIPKLDFEPPVYTAPREERLTRSESERFAEAADPSKQTETYKKKKEFF